MGLKQQLKLVNPITQCIMYKKVSKINMLYQK